MPSGLTTGELPSDDELHALAVGGDPDLVDPGAVPLDLASLRHPGLLPSWYMPGTLRLNPARWWKVLALVLVLAFVFIEATGLCSTYGQLVVP